jgi:hypothetical protein
MRFVLLNEMRVVCSHAIRVALSSIIFCYAAVHSYLCRILNIVTQRRNLAVNRKRAKVLKRGFLSLRCAGGSQREGNSLARKQVQFYWLTYRERNNVEMTKKWTRGRREQDKVKSKLGYENTNKDRNRTGR